MEEKNGNHRNGIPITVIPIRVYVLFLSPETECMTVNQAIDVMLEKFKLELEYKRMEKILKELVAAKMLERDLKPFGKRNKKIAHYTIANDWRKYRRQD